MPRVSVIVPTFNRASLVGEAIDSVLHQSFTDLEIIVVDDGSSDDTESVVRSFSDSRLQYIKQANAGVSAARNAGIRASTGELVAFLDSDDLFLPNKLSLQVAGLDTSAGAGLIFSRYLSGKDVGSRQARGSWYSILELRHLLLGLGVHPSTVVVRRRWLEQVGGFDERYLISEEFDLYLRLALSGCPMAGLPEPLAVVRQEPLSLARQVQQRATQDAMAVLDRAFGDPRMPAEMHALRNTAYAIRLAMRAAAAYLASDSDAGRELLRRALAVDPTSAAKNPTLLANKLVNHVIGLGLGDPKETIRMITAQLPCDDALARRLRRESWASFHTQMAFRSYQDGNHAACADHAIHAILCAPSRLRNRGLLSIFARSLVKRPSNKSMPLPK